MSNSTPPCLRARKPSALTPLPNREPWTSNHAEAPVAEDEAKLEAEIEAEEKALDAQLAEGEKAEEAVEAAEPEAEAAAPEAADAVRSVERGRSGPMLAATPSPSQPAEEAPAAEAPAPAPEEEAPAPPPVEPAPQVSPVAWGGRRRPSPCLTAPPYSLL